MKYTNVHFGQTMNGYYITEQPTKG